MANVQPRDSTSRLQLHMSSVHFGILLSVVSSLYSYSACIHPAPLLIYSWRALVRVSYKGYHYCHLGGRGGSDVSVLGIRGAGEPGTFPPENYYVQTKR